VEAVSSFNESSFPFEHIALMQSEATCFTWKNDLFMVKC